MKCYISFPDEAIFSSVALLEEPSAMQPEEAIPKSAQPMQTNSPVEEAAMEIAKEPTKKEQPPNQFPGCREVLHPSRLVLLLGRFLPSLEDPSGDLIVKVLGREWFNDSGQMS